ncbi:hypothetical protein [Nocardia otitidiscaviarum]|uniref:hypothetical protein n=1 Tax=Nocardia otitidiscaviarum TaxID=1823 RepID=UPI0004A75B52|nr:hypothetical protein [Nocardia otitidiscaviarum]
MSTETLTVRSLLNIPEWAPNFTGAIDRDAHQFRGSHCDECDQPAAVYIEYTVNEPGEGWIATDTSLCGDCACEGVRAILDRADRSTDHDTTVTINYWWSIYAAPASKAAA